MLSLLFDPAVGHVEHNEAGKDYPTDVLCLLSLTSQRSKNTHSESALPFLLLPYCSAGLLQPIIDSNLLLGAPFFSRNRHDTGASSRKRTPPICHGVPRRPQYSTCSLGCKYLRTLLSLQLW